MGQQFVRDKTVLVISYEKRADIGKLEKALGLGEATNIAELKEVLGTNDVRQRPYVCYLYFDDNNVLHEFPTGLGGALLNLNASFADIY